MMPVDSFESNDGSVALLEQLDAQLEFELEASTLLGHGENASEVDPFHAIGSKILARIFETNSAQSTNVDEGSERSTGALLEELGALLTSADANETIDFLPSGSINLDSESDQGIDKPEGIDALGSSNSLVAESLEIALRDEETVEPVSHVVDHASAKIVLLDSQLDFSEALEAAVATDAKMFVYDSTVETASQVLLCVEEWIRTTETQISSLSILSHGAAGGFELGSDWITDNTVGEYLTEFNSLASYFCEDAKIYILGCNVVSDSQGQVLLDRLAEATGAEIYASSDITGFGGDWELESHSFNVLSQDLDELESILDLDSLKSTEVTLAWYNSSWNYRQTVTVDDAMVSGTSDLTNFTILVNVTQDSLKSSSNGGRVGQVDGGDFVFTLADGTTKLSHQIESYNSTTGNLVAWVKLPTLAYIGDTSLFVYYGNATVADQWNAAGSWASDVRANYHLASDFKDSTGNANNATNSGTTAVANAKIAGGDRFNGISSKLAASDSNSLDVTGNLTVSGWFNSSNLSGYKALVAKGTSSTAVNYYVATKGTELQFEFYAAGGLRIFTTSGAGLTTGTWYNFALTYDDTANSVKFYLNGNQIYSATTTHSLVANSGALTIGTSPWNEWFNGSIDEIKIEATTKSASWIQTQYSNQNSPGSYITVLGEQGPPVLTSGSQVSVSEGTNLVTTLTATDPRLTNPTFSYSIVGGPDAARFVIDSATGALSFASAPIYLAPADVGADNVYDIVVQVSSGTLTGTQSLTVSVSSANDAPTIDAGAVYEFVVIDEDSTGPNGTLVSTILSSASYSDVDTNALSGIAVTSLTGVGEWQYSTNGISWTGFGAVMGSNALLLDSSTQIRFLPDGNNGETASFTYRAWDRTTGTASSNGSPQRANATLTGGALAFSDNIANSSITVNDLNDAPIVIDGYTNSLPSTFANMISSSTTVGQLLVSSGYSDVDHGSTSGMAVTASTGLGTWQYSTDGLSWRNFNQVSSSQALLLDFNSQIRYIAPNNLAETATFTYRGWDQSLGTASTDQLAQYADASTSGLTSPFSEEVATANLTVIYINESPIAQIDTSTAIEAGGVSNSTGGVNPTGNVLTNDSDGNLGDLLTVVGVASGTVASGIGSVGTIINGLYGSLVLQANGDYSYVLNNENQDVQGLKGPSKTLNDTFTYTIHDLRGASSSAQLVFTIVGTNDAPHDLTGALSVVENAITGTTVGVVSAADVDSDETFSYSLTDNSGDRFAIDTVTGVITVANGLLLNYESNAEHFITVRTTDQGGLVFDQTLSIGIANVNEAPTAVLDTVQAVEAGGQANSALGVNPTGNALTNDLDQDLSDTKVVVGVAAGLHATTSGSVNTSIEGAYGTLMLAADGSYSYIVANENGDVQRLRTASESLQDVFTYTISDASGLTSTTQITVTIQGSNDAPTTVTDTAIAIEAGGLINGTAGTNPSDNLIANDTDPDDGDTKSVSGVAAGIVAAASTNVGTAVSGTYGTIHIDSNGTYTYTVDNNNATVQALPTVSDTITDVFTYTVTDTDGLTSSSQITVTIQGANDAPTAVLDMATAIEAGSFSNGTAGTNPSGNVLTNDIDPDSAVNGETKSVVGVMAGIQASSVGNVGSSVTGSFGSISISSTGAYIYTVDNSNSTVQALRTSVDTIIDVFTYTMTDAAGATSTTQITVIIQGANDAPVGAADNVTAVEAGGSANGGPGTDPTGNVLTNDTDADAGDTKTVTGVAAGTVGSASDSVDTAVSGAFGTISIAANGAYTYSVDNSNATVQALRTSEQSINDIFSYTVTDTGGLTSTTQITVTIQGANDAPIAVFDTATAVESGGVSNGNAGTSPSGNVLINDADPDSEVNGETKTIVGVLAGTQSSATGNVAASVSGSYGAIQIAANGSYTYNVDNNNSEVQALGTSGNTLTDVFTYAMTDAGGLVSTTQITITIQGANDAPVVVSDIATAVEAGGVANGTAGVSPTGNVLTNDTDVDADDTKKVIGVAAGVQGSAGGSVGSSLTGSYGSITINADGSYSYIVDDSNATVQALRTSSDALQDIFSYTMTDRAGATSTTQITITIQGADDAPVLNGDTADAVESGGYANATAGNNPSGNVLGNDNDVDEGDSMLVSGVSAGVLSSASGSVNTVVNGAFGSITIAGNGSYTYTVDNVNAAVQALLSCSDTLADAFTYTITDASGATTTTQIVVTIHGQNDGPTSVADNTVAVEAGGSSNETLGADATGNVLSNDTDLDSTAYGETKTVSGVAAGVVGNASGSVGSSVNGSYGSITVNDDGSYRYIVDNSNATVQALRTASDTIIDVFTYTMTDTGGLTSTTQITVTIQGSNDSPRAISDTVAAIEAGGLSNETSGTNPTGNVLSNDTDPDGAGTGETKTVVGILAGVHASAAGNVGSSVSGIYGAISISSTGDYTYTVDNSNSTIQALRTSCDKITDVFTYTMNDASGLASSTQITVTIRGENDSPVLFALAPVQIDENTPQGVVVGSAAASDVDYGDSLQFSLIQSYGGAFAIDNTGRIFVNNSSLLDRECVSALTITVRVSDLAGAWAEQNIEVNLNDVDEFDVGTISDSSASSNSIAENAIGGTFVGIVAFALDSDSTLNTIHYTLDDSAGGRFAIAGITGSVYVANASALDFESTNSHMIRVRATSSDGSTSMQCFTIALIDVNETAEALPVFDGSFNLLSGVGTPNPLPGSELPPLASILEDIDQGFRNSNAQEIALGWNLEEAVNYQDQILQPASTGLPSDSMAIRRIGEFFIESTWLHSTEDYEHNEHGRIYVGFMDCESLSSLSPTEILLGSQTSLGMISVEQKGAMFSLSDFTWDDLVPIGVWSVLVIWSAYIAKLGSSLLVSACGGFFLLPSTEESEEKKNEKQRILRRFDKFN